MTTVQQKRYFEFQDSKSAKFWEVTTDGTTVTVRYGKIGTNGQSQTKELADAAAAAKHVAKLVAEKTGKGYVESGDSAVAQAASEPVSEIAPTAPRKKAVITNPAKDPDASPESLLALLNQDDTTNRLLARHPRASADLLEKLSHSSDKATRQAVTANPATPPEVYLRLGQQFPKEFLANPMLDLLLLERPALLHEQPDTLLVQILRHSICPVDFLLWAAGHESEKVQLAVAMNPKAPEQAKEKLRQSPYAKVRESLPQIQAEITAEAAEAMFREEVRKRLAALTPSEAEEAWHQKEIGLPQWPWLSLKARLSVAEFKFYAIKDLAKQSENVLTALATAKDEDLRTIAAETPSTPPTVLDGLSQDESKKVRCAVASNPSTPKEILLPMTNDNDEDVRCQVGKNPSSPLEVLQAMAKDKATELRSSVARNTSSPPMILENLAQDKAEIVRCSVAKNTSTPLNVLQGLTKDRLVDVRQCVAWNLSSPSSALDALSQDKNEFVRKGVAWNPKSPQAVLENLSNDKSKYVRKYVAENSSLPLNALEKLASDREEDIRQVVARNHGISEATFELLSKDRSPHVRLSVAENPSCPTKVLEEIIQNDLIFWSEYVARNPSIPTSLMEAMAQDERTSVRRSIAANPRTTLEILLTLAKDKVHEVRGRVASNPSTAGELLESLANDKMVEVRANVVRNPRCPKEVLDLMARDKSSTVRDGVALNQNTPTATLVVLSKDQDEQVRKSVAGNPNTPKEVLVELAQEHNTSLRTALLNNQNFPQDKKDRMLTSILIGESKDDAWFLGEVQNHDDDIKKAAAEDDFLHNSGNDPIRSARGTRSIGKILALCSESIIDPSVIARVSVSTDWLIRAAVARNSSTPPNILSKLVKDVHPVVSTLAKAASR